MNSMHSASRRDFLKKALLGAAALRAGGGIQLQAAEQGAAKSKVVIARDAQLRGSGSAVDSRRLLALLDRAVQALFDRDHASEAWKMLVKPGELVGLKVNTLGGRGISSNLQLVEAICERLQEAGIQANAIVVWDRETEELERAGFHIATDGKGVQCFGTDRVDYQHFGPYLAAVEQNGSQQSLAKLIAGDREIRRQSGRNRQ